MKKNVVVFNRLAPDLVDRLATRFNVVQLASSADLPEALAAGPVHGLIGAGWQLGRTQLAAWLSGEGQGGVISKRYSLSARKFECLLV